MADTDARQSVTLDDKKPIEALSERLATFLAAHDKSTIESRSEDDVFFLRKPWNDDSIAIAINISDDKIVNALNSVYLPERYSALFHISERRLEVIFTVFPPKGDRADIATRKFDFIHNGRTHKCCFAPSSDSLLHISKHSIPVGGTSETNHRNIMLYSSYMTVQDRTQQLPEEIREIYRDASPISFWIDNIDWNEEAVANLAMHLNFFMFYYDKETPQIIIHTAESEGRVSKEQTRYAKGQFPSVIKSKNIDQDLLHFWQASTDGDSSRRILHSYQILEYAAFYMVEEDVAKNVIRLLSSPDAISNASDISSRIIEFFGETKLTDPQKIEMVIRRFVQPEIVWDAIRASKDSFTKQTTFDGGYVVPALVKENWALSDFAQNWPSPFAGTIRGIRNALSHGREQRMSAVITPTEMNMRRLQPWAPLVAAAARETMIFWKTL